MPKVSVIPATRHRFTSAPIGAEVKRRTAAYARVSTDKDEQVNSYEAQVDYYTKYISERPDWELISIYTDEGISAVSTKKRDGFNQMVSDALAGKLDLIVTKSVSRFARNTVVFFCYRPFLESPWLPHLLGYHGLCECMSLPCYLRQRY
jgi:predicted site-specific integrase-resolvase